MKKEYEAPKAEKIEFDYDDIVTASGGTTTNAGDNSYWKCTGSSHWEDNSTSYWGC